MPNIHPVDPAHTDTRTTATLNAVHRKLGVLPNIFTTFAHSPTALNAYLQLSETLAGGRLSAAQRERIALTVAEENACEYCLSAHATIGRSAGLDDRDIALARDGDAPDVGDARITSFARQIAQGRAELTDGEFTMAREAGLDDGLMVEIVANVALNVMTNYLNKLAGTEVDFPRVALRDAA